MCQADGTILGDGNASPDNEACSAFSWMLRSRRFLNALVPASWIDEPNLKVCAGLLHSRLVRFEVVIGNHRALNLLNVSSYTQMMVIGAALIVAVALDQAIVHRRLRN